MTFIHSTTSIILLLFYVYAPSYHFSLYKTQLRNEAMSYDCIYHKIHRQHEFDGKKREVWQLIEYCIRLSSKDKDDAVNGSIASALTFDELRKENITVENLVTWSCSIETIEQYQHFLHLNKSSSNELFYNCTRPWFGLFCQYKFPWNQSFSKIVDLTFESKSYKDPYANVACYIHMKCNRGSPLLCLDWREICDGRIDCIDGGEDEKYCFELHINRCAPNEYQCRNGMCIDEDFFLETGIKYSFGYECLDRSDEPLESDTIKGCLNDPSFQCEDVVCPSSNSFNCGDGNCVHWPVLDITHDCRNNRDQMFNALFHWHSQDTALIPICIKIGMCARNMLSSQGFNKFCTDLCKNVQTCEIYLENCPSYIFAYDFPIWDGHVRIGYFLNRTMSKSNSFKLPHFACFDRDKCPFLIPTFEIDNYTCLNTHTRNISTVDKFYTIFLSCIHLYQNFNAINCPETSMIRCSRTNKCIPERYIMDGISDCYEAFDESLAANSCLLNKKHRFQCTSENKCISLVAMHDGKPQCVGKEDELHDEAQVTSIEQLPFSAICDGRREFYSSINDSDETDCELWPCVNQYTRCNGVWNCFKGIDEMNCPSKFNCPGDYHPCVFPKTQTMGCLHLSRIEDGIMDCLGGTDERKFCFELYPTKENYRYRCWNQSECVRYTYRCSRCNQLDDIDELCPESEENINNILTYFDRMDDIFRVSKLPFSHHSSQQFPRRQSIDPINRNIQHNPLQTKNSNNMDRLDSRRAWICHRGILVYYGKNESERCLCPPSYYGDHCQYQSQRVSLTLRLRKENVNKLDVISIIITLIDSTNFIHSHEQLTYMPIHDCTKKFNIYLLYADRPKDMTKNYTVHIDAYDKVKLIYLISWRLPIKFLFMPVNRISSQLVIPAHPDCTLSCNPKLREKQTNTYTHNCRCKSKMSEIYSIDKIKCNCSLDSLCIGIINNRSICLCPLTKISPRCLLDSVCKNTMCMNGGICVPYDDRISLTQFKCVCPDGFSGNKCEHTDAKIDISFDDVSIPQSILAHFITVREFDFRSINPMPIRATMFKKIGFDEDIVTFFMSLPFHLLFTQIENKYYLTLLQHKYIPSAAISTEITPFQYCPHIRELFNESIIHFPIVRRVKYYHLACMEKSNLVCFQDSQIFICLCTQDRHANCFHFDFNMTYKCTKFNNCENEAQCFQDNPTCPTKTMCVCRECFYGTTCQFSTQQFSLSLDMILGYQIRPSQPIRRQSLYVKASIGVASIMLVVCCISGILSILTFQSKSCRKFGCGTYLLASSVTSVLTIISLNLKVWFLILSHMLIIKPRSFLLSTCILTDFTIRSLLAITDWFHACVAVERIVTILLDVNFNVAKSKTTAKLLVILICLSTSATFLYDPIHRQLVEDREEKRTWCIVRLTSSMENFNSFINIFHFVIPFVLKLISAISIIVLAAKKRASIRKQRTYIEHLKIQFAKHRHLIISSNLLVILALPRLIISFSSGCMKSARKPLIFLIGYFISFVPSLLTFFIFVSTSKTYEKEFKIVVRRKWKAFRRRFN